LAIPVIDIFAGPGGLSEGFSSLRDQNDNPVFQVVLSVEKEKVAGKTLRLRAFIRKFTGGEYPEEYFSYMKEPAKERKEALVKAYKDEWDASGEEVWIHTLKEEDNDAIEKIGKAIGDAKEWVLIGGPPCQAYSLVGRARRKHEAREVFDKDSKHTLYKCYLGIIAELKPTAFIMENVRGLISAKHKNDCVFEQIKTDFDSVGYSLYSMIKPDSADSLEPQDYLICSEEYGIPQARHRVVFFGIKKGSERNSLTLKKGEHITAQDVLDNMPRIRSGFSKREKEWKDWERYVRHCAKNMGESKEEPICSNLELQEAFKLLEGATLPGESGSAELMNKPISLDDWYRKEMQNSLLITNHESRNHIALDVKRYLYCSVYAQIIGYAPKLTSFPPSLLPAHNNIADWIGKKVKPVFSDRFKVQLCDNPSSTITSHIAKDGHYYIHYDPTQCRSLTVREAARLQTFPDDYFFEGNRTEQYQQVGNAVPPLLSEQIAGIIADYLGISSRPYYGLASR